MVAKEGKEIYNLEHYNKQEESGGYYSANQFQHFDAIRPALGIYVLRLHTGLSTFFYVSYVRGRRKLSGTV